MLHRRTAASTPCLASHCIAIGGGGAMVDVFAYHVGCPDEERERQAVIAVALIPTLQARRCIWALKSRATPDRAAF